MNIEILSKLINLEQEPSFKNKEFFTITEVFKLTKINTHTLRYWEKNGLITPVKIHNGQRRYNEEHLNLILKIKELIYDEKIGIKGVKKIIKSKSKKTQNKAEDNSYNQDMTKFLDEMKKELKSILKLLK